MAKKNFPIGEKNLLLDFVRKNAIIIENKSNDVKIWKAKKEKWIELSELLHTYGYNRDWHRLREYYQRTKSNAKTTITRYLKFHNETGADLSSLDVPTEFDWAIHNICPNEFNAETGQQNGADENGFEGELLVDDICATDFIASTYASDSDQQSNTEVLPIIKQAFVQDENYIKAQIKYLEKKNRREQKLHEVKMKVEQLKMRNEELIAEKLQLEINRLRK